MFANATNVGIAQRVVATLVACAVVLASIGVYSTAQAANLTQVSDTLSDSDVSVTSSHTIAFTIPTASSLGTGQTTTITFPAGFTGVNTVVSGDVVVTVNGTPDATSGFTAVGQVISFAGVAATAGQEVVVAIADGKITNPAGPAASHQIVVATPTDTGKTRVAIIDNVLVTAIVQTTFDFTITGVATSSANINGTTTTGSTSPTTIPFGALTAGQTKTLGQRLNVTTNARNGYVVTVEQDGNLASSNGADIDAFIDGAYTDTPTSWNSNAPTNVLLDEDTWGHWGLTSTDGDLKGTGIAFTGTNQYVAASTTPRAIMAHDGPSDGTTGTVTAAGDDVGQTYVGYQVRITPLQEAADDYNTTLTYIATPTF